MINCQIVFLVQAVQQIQVMVDGLYQYPQLRAETQKSDKEGRSRSDAFTAIEDYSWVLNDSLLQSQVWRLKGQLQGNHAMSPEVLIRELELIRDMVVMGLSRKKFAFIPESAALYFEQDYLFGPWVYEKFPFMRDDIRDAGNCLASGLSTAAVFHLMRIAESGFRFVVKKAKVPMTDNKKALHVDYAGWEKVIQGLNNVASVKRKTEKGPKWEANAQFYADLADQCAFFRDVYRDKTMHARKRYNHPEAEGAFIRVKQFITLLAGEPK